MSRGSWDHLSNTIWMGSFIVLILALVSCGTPPASSVGRYPSMERITSLDFSPPSETAIRMSLPLPEGWLMQTAQVRNVRGQAFYWNTNQSWQPLLVGELLSEGAIIQTDLNSHCDLFLQWNGPVIRIAQGSFLVIDQLRFSTNGNPSNFQTVFNLKRGRLLGSVKPQGSSFLYEIRIPEYVITIGENQSDTSYDSSADGRVIVLTGNIVISSGDFTIQIPEGHQFDPVTRKVQFTKPDIPILLPPEKPSKIPFKPGGPMASEDDTPETANQSRL